MCVRIYSTASQSREHSLSHHQRNQRSAQHHKSTHKGGERWEAREPAWQSTTMNNQLVRRAHEVLWNQTNNEAQRGTRQPTAIYIERSMASVEQPSKNPRNPHQSLAQHPDSNTCVCILVYYLCSKLEFSYYYNTHSWNIIKEQINHKSS